MLELTKHYGQGPTSIAQISHQQDIPIKYLEQLIIPLKKAKLISSVRGPKGGHMLSRPPETINLWEVLTLLEKKMTFVDCVNDETLCPNTADCPVRPIWGKALVAIKKIFLETSLADLLSNEKDFAESLGVVSHESISTKGHLK